MIRVFMHYHIQMMTSTAGERSTENGGEETVINCIHILQLQLSVMLSHEKGILILFEPFVSINTLCLHCFSTFDL